MALNSRASQAAAEDHDYEVDDVDTGTVDEMIGDGGSNSMSGMKENDRDLRGKSRVEDKEPQKKFGWQIMEDEWMAKWGEATDTDFDTLQSANLPLEQREPPKEVLGPLLACQKEWLAWCMKQEAGSFKGGILADEMGMTKISQAMISLVVTDRALNQSRLRIDVDMSAASSSDAAHYSSSETEVVPQIKGTLVVCPPSSIRKWRYEISRFTLNGSFKVLVYHGLPRNVNISEIGEYDIIVTSYSILEIEHREKEFCMRCGKLFCTGSIGLHQRKPCDNSVSNREKNEEIFGRSSDRSDLEDDLEHMEKGDTVGQNEVSGEDLEKKRGKSATTIKTSMERRKIDQASGSVLYAVRWRRIILDEANSLKNRRCNTAKAILALQSECKWALSGYLKQNRMDELYSLIRFLGANPFAHFFCEYCECQSLERPSTTPGERCKCGHFPSQHFSWWKKFVATPISRCPNTPQGRKGMMRLKHQVLSNILFGRTKLERQTSNPALPMRTATIRRDALDSQEKEYYDDVFSQCKMEYRSRLNAGPLIGNPAHLSAMITRLRQAANHYYLVEYSAAIKDTPSFKLCGICHEPPEDCVVTTGCRHNFCRSCIRSYIAAGPEFTSPCPKCLKPLKLGFTEKSSKDAKEVMETKICKQSSILNGVDFQNFRSSTKIEAVRMETVQMLQEDPSAKAIIFSEFTSMLHLLGFALEKSGIKFVMLDGNMSMTTRDQMIDKFTNNHAETRILLLSFKAPVPHDLTVASHVFLMDPCWHPSIERLALAPVHRIGQHRAVKVIRFVIENTIEELILEFQETKELTAMDYSFRNSYRRLRRYAVLRLLRALFASDR